MAEEVDSGWLTVGVILALLGYGGSVATSALALGQPGRVPFDDTTCYDRVAGFSFIPLVGTSIGVATACSNASYRRFGGLSYRSESTFRINSAFPVAAAFSNGAQIAGLAIVLAALAFPRSVVVWEEPSTGESLEIAPAVSADLGVSFSLRTN